VVNGGPITPSSTRETPRGCTPQAVQLGAQRRETCTATERAHAVAEAAAVGPIKAAEQLGIPRRTIQLLVAPARPFASDLLGGAGHCRPAARCPRSGTYCRHGRAQRPEARLADRARALEVLGEQMALAEGRATAHNFNANVDLSPADALTWEERDDLRRLRTPLRMRSSSYRRAGNELGRLGRDRARSGGGRRGQSPPPPRSCPANSPGRGTPPTPSVAAVQPYQRPPEPSRPALTPEQHLRGLLAFHKYVTAKLERTN